MKVYMYYYNDKNYSTPLLYAYTIDKKVAKNFEEFRDMKKFIRIAKRMTHDEYEKFHQPREELSMQPLTDGNLTYEMALTYTELNFVSGIVSSIEDLAMENRRMIEMSFFTPKVKDLLLRMNQPWEYGKNEELCSIIDTVKIFYDYYKNTLK
nr:MAG TPA: hypothetical protein [Caudoviricetes sp.]